MTQTDDEVIAVGLSEEGWKNLRKEAKLAGYRAKEYAKIKLKVMLAMEGIAATSLKEV